MSKLKVLDLFSGIGGFSLGLEKTGYFETVAFCEIDNHAKRVLNKHWPNVPVFDDVRDLDYGLETIKGADVVTAGFPCQDISHAGKGAGLSGERSGLWWRVRRAIRMVRPQFAVLENVAALLNRGMGTVLGSLASIGYDTEWHCIRATAVGAIHKRDRVWIVANDYSQRKQGRWGEQIQRFARISWCENVRRLEDLPERCDLYESKLCRSRHGISERLDSCGNAVVPQIVENIGNAIIKQHLKGRMR